MANVTTESARVIDGVMKTITIICVIAAVAPGFGYLHFVLDLFSHFKAHFLLAFLILAAFFTFTKSYPWTFLAIAGAMYNLSYIAPWYVGDSNVDNSDDHDSLKVLFSNVLMHNPDASQLLNLVAHEQPDILGLVEVSQSWIDRLSSLREMFPYHIESPSEDYRGLALFSRLPITEFAVADFGDVAAKTIVADIVVDGSTYQFLLAHAFPPMTKELAGQRNAQLQHMGEYVSNAETPVVLIGDLNITMWDRTYRLMIRESGLINSRAGYGLGGTWPSISPLRIPIDHILVEAPLQSGGFRVHESIGSDHLPISARVLLRR